MADHSKIEWTDATWNIVTGCSVLSPGCTNCYAMKLAGTRLKHHPSREGLTRDTKAGPVWTGEVRFNEQWLTQPLQWKRGRKIFVCAHGDLFHEGVKDEWLDQIFAVMALCPQHTFQVLTKRSDRMRAYLTAEGLSPFDGRLLRIQGAAYRLMASLDGTWNEARGLAARQACVDALLRLSEHENAGFKNVWLGVSVEDQQRADQRREDFRATPGAVKFVSYEPALDVVDWTGWEFLDQLISGGESGNNARYIAYSAFREARDWCAARGVAFFHKQNGAFDETGQKVGKKAGGRLLDGVEHNGVPEVSHV